MEDIKSYLRRKTEWQSEEELSQATLALCQYAEVLYALSRKIREKEK